jgi:glycosyltransferase involved in cell wall biosynthesis
MMGTLINRGLMADSKVSPTLKILPPTANILLLGFGFYLRRISGDKNFWLELSKELSAELDKLVIVSVNSSPVKFEQEGNIYLYNVQRPLHRKKDDERVLRFQFQKHPLPWEILERTATLFKLIPFLKKMVKLHNIQVIHLMDNFGFSTGLVKTFFPNLGVYATAITYNMHNLPPSLYSFYQKLIFGNLDKIVVSSQAYRERLMEHEVSSEKVEVIHWGVPFPNGPERTHKKRRKKHSSPKSILWTGFTQQIKEKSFNLTLSVAKSPLKGKSSPNFVFAFKPECFHKRYELFQDEHVQVMATSHQDFLKLLEEVDLLLAPLDNLRSTVAPPLTWIECMAMGVPIISTHAPGVDEIIKHNHTGFVAKTNQELGVLMEKVLEDEDLLSEVSRNAKEWVKQNYNLEQIAQDYLRLWRKDGRVILSSKNRISE